MEENYLSYSLLLVALALSTFYLCRWGRLYRYFSRGPAPNAMRSDWDKQADKYALGCWVIVLLIFAIPAAITLAAIYFPGWFYSDQNPLN